MAVSLVFSDGELSKLKEGGFSGFRVKANGKGGLSFEETRRMIARTVWPLDSLATQPRTRSTPR